MYLTDNRARKLLNCYEMTLEVIEDTTMRVNAMKAEHDKEMEKVEEEKQLLDTQLEAASEKCNELDVELSDAIEKETTLKRKYEELENLWMKKIETRKEKVQKYKDQVGQLSEICDYYGFNLVVHNGDSEVSDKNSSLIMKGVDSEQQQDTLPKVTLQFDKIDKANPSVAFQITLAFELNELMDPSKYTFKSEGVTVEPEFEGYRSVVDKAANLKKWGMHELIKGCIKGWKLEYT